MRSIPLFAAVPLAAAAAWLLVPAEVRAQDTARDVEIERVEVHGTRLLKDTGMQRTRLDSAALHDNIALSMGDVLLQNTNTFIKSYGRGTMSTVSVRGTAPSHTRVTWNGMPLNSPMLGSVDFSLVPSYFIDDASLYAGASASDAAAGSIGGAVALDNRPPAERGFALRYIQGAGSFATFDEYLRLAYGGERWSLSTRVLYASSRNDFKYTNYARLPELSADPSDGSPVRKYPRDRNRNGDYGDFHLLQEFYGASRSGDRFGAAVWYTCSDRGVPKLSTDYRDDSSTRASQRESTLRAVLSWRRIVRSVGLSARAGYTWTDMLYRYLFDITGTGGEMIEGVHSRSRVHSAFGRFEAEYSLRERLMVSASLTATQHFVSSMDESVYDNASSEAIVGYRQSRFEVGASASLRWRPLQRLGVAASVRWDLYGERSSPVAPALFADFLLSRRGNVALKASAAFNYRYPTLNDLYFQPGGNPDLKPERGFTVDGGASFAAECAGGRVKVSGEVSAFDSYVNDWILWRPTFKGFWTPLNIRRVQSYGFEVKAALAADLGRGWRIAANAFFSMTRSLNRGEQVSVNDSSYGRQLPYIPVYTSSASGTLSWRGWSLAYKWRYYSERFTVSSGEMTPDGVVAPYFMNDVSLGKRFDWRWGALSVRADVNNLFGEEYETVLSHPMPGRNFEIFVGIAPDFGAQKRRQRRD